MKDRSDDPSHHERTLLQRSYPNTCGRACECFIKIYTTPSWPTIQMSFLPQSYMSRNSVITLRVWRGLECRPTWRWPASPACGATGCAACRPRTGSSQGRPCCSWHARGRPPSAASSWWRAGSPPSSTAGGPSWPPGSPQPGPRRSAVWSAPG